MAWLHAVPRDEKDAKRNAKRQTRIAVLADKDIEPEWPEIDAGAHLIRYLLEVGPTMPAGMGAAPVSWAEIDAWMRRTGIRLVAWEARLLRDLSSAYLGQHAKSDSFDAEPPYGSDVANRVMKAAAVRESMRSLAANAPAPKARRG